MNADADHPMSALPGFTLRRAANAMMAELAGRLVALDLKISDASVLLLVGGRADMTSSDIGRLLDIQRANMVPLLNRLEGAGLIMREPIDRKSQAIVLTPEGEAKLEEVRATTARFEGDLMARIPAEHREHFLPALNALLD
ncbi:MarR family winged helix-turn-helix transcriptional regulator [Novosphingobium terrae]|uniref:MarR family winged helix-turn-helix transcriptional regulator n=1 Tax=Novosphingobium terrae TaxID=2726189 RepID=UPI001F12FC85|nr:MarR family transcriptional regulator [Novosphingobium terrae]